MIRFVAFSLVPVALLAAAAPAAASSGAAIASLAESGNKVLYDGQDGAARNEYWTASNQHRSMAVPSMINARGGRPLRRVMVSGYAPAGFGLAPNSTRPAASPF